MNTDEEFSIGSYLKLSYRTRMYGFIMFAITGFILSFVGSLMLFSMNFIDFGIMYSLGNICTLISTLFLFGPISQIKSMFKSLHKAMVMIIYILAIILTLIAALKLHNVGLCIVFIVIQFIALIWYTIISLPGGQTICCSLTQSAAL